MVLHKTIHHLRQGSKEDRVAVASGVAFAVVAVLFIGWAVFFVRGVARTTQSAQVGTGVQQAQQTLQQDFSNFPGGSTEAQPSDSGSATQ